MPSWCSQEYTDLTQKKLIIKLYRANLLVRSYSVLPNTDEVLGDIAVGINSFQNILITRVYAEYKTYV